MVDELRGKALGLLHKEQKLAVQPFLEEIVLPLIHKGLDSMGYDKTVFRVDLEDPRKLDMRPELNYNSTEEYYYLLHRSLDKLNWEKFPYELKIKNQRLIIGILRPGASFGPIEDSKGNE